MSRRHSGAGDARAQRLRRKRASLESTARHPVTTARLAQVVEADMPAEHQSGEPGTRADDPVERQAIVVTHLIPVTPWAPGLSGRVRYTGHGPGAGDRLERWEILEHLPPGADPYSLTSVFYDVVPGAWEVEAELVPPGEPDRLPIKTALPLVPAAWSWMRWKVAPTTRVPVASRWAPLAPLARMPAILPGAWAMLCAVATVLALVVLVQASQVIGLAVGDALSVTVIAIVAGLVGARAWFAFLHPELRLFPGGWAVDGFLVAAPAGAVLAAFVLRVPIGAYLDASAPALFIAVAVARVGCFLAGCCAGRISTSRWAVWSSDHRIGARRLPTQLFESAAGGALAILAAAALLPLGGTGLVFVLAMGTYLVIRQLLLRLRAEARPFSWRRAAPPRMSTPAASNPGPGGPMAQPGLTTDRGPGR